MDHSKLKKRANRLKPIKDAKREELLDELADDQFEQLIKTTHSTVKLITV